MGAGEIRDGMRGMQTQFDEFERWIIQKLVDVQSLYLKGIREELATLQVAIKDMLARPFLSMPIIEKIYEKE